jgi:MinD superfamily P-loop ATPase
MEQTAYPDVYGLWTNKGGVGKTTLSYHMCNTYAELFPNKAVVAIDMCPQANLSSTLLTNVAGAKRCQSYSITLLHAHAWCSINAMASLLCSNRCPGAGYRLHLLQADST